MTNNPWEPWRQTLDVRALSSPVPTVAVLPDGRHGGPADLVRLGESFENEGRYQEALSAYQGAMRMEPWTGDHGLRIGNLLTAMNRAEEAERQYRQSVAVDPNCFPAWAMLGQTYANQGRMELAEFAYQRAIQVRPDPKAKIVLGSLLPPIYSSVEAIDRWQAQLRDRLAQLHTQGVSVDPTREAIPNLFMLAYQGGNVRDVQQSFATLFKPPAETLECRVKPSADGRIRVGVLSEYLCNHTIGTLNRGLAQHLDRQRFHLTVLSAAGSDDETAQHYRRCADRFVPLSKHVPQARAAMRDVDLDILFFTDIGMSCLTLALACTRHAPVQCVTWGHPLTTGLPSMDYFISGQLYETPEADAHYTETLVRLPGLQTCYPRPDQFGGRRTREDFGLPADKHLYGCPQTLFKFHPEFDPILADILRRDPQGLLVLIEGKHPNWNLLLRERWQRTMPDVADRVQFLPAVPRGDFLTLSKVVDVLLDPLHFGGGNTTLEAMAVGTPVVTWPTPFLRARLAYGMYQHMGWLDCVAGSADEYVQKCVRLGSDAEANRQARSTIARECPVLFDHVPSVRAFETFFVEAFERSRQ